MSSRYLLPLALLVLYVFHLGSVGFLGPDEPRYASIGREMAQSGDWITPRLNGAPWFEKSPLVYWMTAIATRAGLRDEWAARLPIALMSVAFLAFFLRILQREFSASVALTAAVILSTSAGWLGYSFAAVMDLPVTAALGAATLIAVFDKALFDTRPLRAWLAGALLGVAMLAKGFEPLVYFAPVWLFAGKRRWAMAGSAIAVAAPWYLLCAWRNGSAFWSEFFWKHHVERFFSATALQHGQKFWYYLPVLLALLFPWTPLTALLARKQIYADARVRFLLIWGVLAPLVFFTVAQNKLPGYILPVLPALSIVLAVAVDQSPQRAWWLAACVALMVCLPTVAAALPEALLVGVRKTEWTFALTGLPFLLAAAAVWWLARPSNVWPHRVAHALVRAASALVPTLASVPRTGVETSLDTARTSACATLAAAALTVATGVIYLKVATFPVLDRQVSVRSFWLAHQEQASNSCLEASVRPAWKYGLNYYAGHALSNCQDGQSGGRVVEQDGELAVVPAHPPER